jgi:hypothetical protein
MAETWIAGMHMEKGALHRDLGVPVGKKIPGAKLRAALAGKKGPATKKRAVLAKTLMGFH